MKKIKVYGAIGIGVITVSILMMAITNSPWFMLGIIAGGAVAGANSAKLTDIHRKLLSMTALQAVYSVSPSISWRQCCCH